MEYFLRWYQHLAAGGIGTLGERFTDYPPTYSYLLGVAVALRPWLEPVAAIKMMSIVFDLVAALMAYLIIGLREAGVRPLLGALLLLNIPTVWLNGAAWGQSDVMYTAFLLGTVYAVLRGWPAWTMTAFGLAFAFKLQAVFLVPFLLFEWWRRRDRLTWWLLPPTVYVGLGLPTVLLGLPVGDMLWLYLRQARIFSDLSVSASSAWAVCFLTPDRCRGGAGWLGVAVVLISLALVSATVWAFWRLRARDPFESTMMAATCSVLLVPFILPRMHERYFFPADVLSLLLAICIPRLWYVAVGIQAASILAYGTYLWGWTSLDIVRGAALNAACLVALLYEAGRDAPSPRPRLPATERA